MQRVPAKSATVVAVLAAIVVAPFAGGRAHADESVDVHASASVAMSAMNGNSARVRTMLRKAREERRASATRCLDGALSRVDAALRSGRDEDRFLEAALAKNDLVGARRALATLLGYREATRLAALDADACTSIVDVVPRDATVVKIVVDPTLPNDRTVFGR